MDRHAMVIGGTGMLRGACTDLAARGWTVSVIARSHAQLASLRTDTAARTGRPTAINPVPVDYTDIPALALGLRAAATAHGPVSLAVCYIHSTAPLAPIVVADTLGSSTRPCTFIHVVGSASPDELRQDSTRDEIAANPGVAYRRVILGFMRHDGSTRWLTDHEICSGVLRAIDDPTPEQVVGVVSPWELHPPL
jgi:NAD(P)-dependent dehydrogenase (short-subunit alcohol dehydrogenase family)